MRHPGSAARKTLERGGQFPPSPDSGTGRHDGSTRYTTRLFSLNLGTAACIHAFAPQRQGLCACVPGCDQPCFKPSPFTASHHSRRALPGIQDRERPLLYCDHAHPVPAPRTPASADTARQNETLQRRILKCCGIRVLKRARAVCLQTGLLYDRPTESWQSPVECT